MPESRGLTVDVCARYYFGCVHLFRVFIKIFSGGKWKSRKKMQRRMV